ncbi:MAG: alpha/beta hydrolase [Acidimicrobiales bacterium]|nr:alpha/beta hydrolase [Acidimicrobiales bacterium]MDP6696307.1 alpha/beta hydrolase [Acidimicrobiales bacterium]
MTDFDEFSVLVDNAAEAGLEWGGPPVVRRCSMPSSDGLMISGLLWGDGDPELVLLHGGAQNSHTWDTVALALGRPLVAVDLPGHGHSDWRPDHDYRPAAMVDVVASAVEVWAPAAEAVVGMSLGGLTALCLAADRPDLVRRLGIVDVTPGTDRGKSGSIIDFMSGPDHFDDFEAMLAYTVGHNPHRTEESLVRGLRHNARELPDGRWTWRWDPMRDWKMTDEDGSSAFDGLWDKLGQVTCPVHLWLGGSWSVVDDADTGEFLNRCPQTEVTAVEGAGHSIQGSRPVELAALIDDLLAAGY